MRLRNPHPALLAVSGMALSVIAWSAPMPKATPERCERLASRWEEFKGEAEIAFSGTWRKPRDRRNEIAWAVERRYDHELLSCLERARLKPKER